ncbi:MAG: bifunctional riboflavin kinase/FAD synthetase [Leptospirales bacterium]|jgi:riboflavin kinase/FMN adenylyltransferase
MLVIHDLNSVRPEWESCALTLGVFDGMHRGHQALINRVQKRSRGSHGARVLVTYHPHPDLVLGKRDAGRSELFTYDEKLALYQKFDLDAVVFLPFTKELARMTALRYLKEILLGQLRARHIIIGYDQRFGRGRKGDYAFLKQMSRKYEFKVEQIGAVRYRGAIVSTSRIRGLIEAGSVSRANRLLGHDFFIEALIVRGQQRGATIGFPTANLAVPPTKTVPAGGVYTAVAEVGQERFRAMVNVGVNPTFGNNQLSVEAHLLDFSGDLYGERIRLFFRDRMRDERKFESIDALKAQLQKDRVVAAKMKL